MGQTLSQVECCGARKGVESPSAAQSTVRARWEAAHKTLPDPSARVPATVFASVNACGAQSRQAEYGVFLAAVFEASTALMLPAVKADLGKHCFGYGCLLADEFYFDSKAGPADKLKLVTQELPCDSLLLPLRQELDGDWAAVKKDSDGRVTGSTFREHCLSKYAKQLGDVAAVRQNYEKFLAKVFDVGLKMSGTTKGTLGGHCFRYATLFAGEFYFAAAQESATPGCGCNTPVADVLRITK
eukprot:TRINITY_DN27667_c0_g1_i1.p1 TRINITY_DN27667_c0_g1~~TRINITY_DN27667_c0_g1_i1.p1  ORF type:complete len:242 (-),score=60.07 TRINITY_DN27667_c0_g1_i1:12-737(-)